MIANDYFMVKLDISQVCSIDSSSLHWDIWLPPGHVETLLKSHRQNSQNLRKPLPDKGPLPAANSKPNTDSGFVTEKKGCIALHQTRRQEKTQICLHKNRGA